MDGKKIIGIAVSSILLAGNCIASEDDATETDQDESTLRKKLKELTQQCEILAQQNKIIFTSLDDVRNYMRRRRIDGEWLKACLERTWVYWRDGNIP
ncbi:MAG: hypothetical protein LBF34_04190 [Puniceicoccales bacterium]|jgi:archaellum biogenesis ATPase FlaH|nr:hypothetical protein [Puniceicoccales bacterium]